MENISKNIGDILFEWEVSLDERVVLPYDFHAWPFYFIDVDDIIKVWNEEHKG